jgi:hypothetical protein
MTLERARRATRDGAASTPTTVPARRSSDADDAVVDRHRATTSRVGE